MALEGTVFGLDVSANVGLPFLPEDGTGSTGRALELLVDEHAGTTTAWPRGAEIVCDQREGDGNVGFRIEADPKHGYLIRGPRYGSHFLSRDGRQAIVVPEGAPDGCWQRLLIAQVLPFAAALQGLEVFHASAVATPLGAVAFLGPSGAGKTSLAVELCHTGAEFLADDVLALEREGETLIAHPGTAAAAVDAADIEALCRARCGTRSSPMGDVLRSHEHERLVHVRSRGGPTRLAAMFLLEPRSRVATRPRFLPLRDARALLASTFNSVLVDGERLARLLDVCATAARGRVERVVAGTGGSPAQLALAVTRRLGTAR